MYDVIFVHNNSVEQLHNLSILSKIAPHVKEISNCTSIHDAFVKSSVASSTSHYYMVDGDNVVLNNFKFNHQIQPGYSNFLFIFDAKNPINGLEYGHGGIKLIPKGHGISNNNIDYTMSYDHIICTGILASIHRYNTSSYNTWRTSVRECMKLIHNGDQESLRKYDIWKNIAHSEYSSYNTQGALCAMNMNISFINNDRWLKTMFYELYGGLHDLS